MGASGSRSTSRSRSLSLRCSDRATDPKTAMWRTPMRRRSASCASKIRKLPGVPWQAYSIASLPAGRSSGETRSLLGASFRIAQCWNRASARVQESFEDEHKDMDRRCRRRIRPDRRRPGAGRARAVGQRNGGPAAKEIGYGRRLLPDDRVHRRTAAENPVEAHTEEGRRAAGSQLQSRHEHRHGRCSGSRQQGKPHPADSQKLFPHPGRQRAADADPVFGGAGAHDGRAGHRIQRSVSAVLEFRLATDADCFALVRTDAPARRLSRSDRLRSAQHHPLRLHQRPGKDRRSAVTPDHPRLP